MSSSANDLNTLNGNFKEVYADKIENLIPDGVKFLNKLPFSSKEAQLGNYFHSPVIVGLEHGFTFSGAGEDAFALNAPVAGQLKDAQVRGCQIVLRSVMGYASASRAAQGKAAFMDATKFLVQNMLRSFSKKLEVVLFYGQMGIAAVDSILGNAMTITTAEWAPGIWAGAENMPIEVRTAAGVLRGICNVSSVDVSLKKVTVDAAPLGVAATDVIWFKGAYGNEFAGLHKILTNSGSLFGISAADYSLWSATSYSAAAASLSHAKIQDAIASGMAKGLDGDVEVFINVKAWADLMTEQAALRMFDSSYSTKEMENGSQEIRFHGQNGKVSIIPSIYVKEGYAYVLTMDDFVRIGSSDITFRRPGKGDEFFRELENAAGYELRAYTDQALFCHRPGGSVIITSIVN